MREPLTPAQRSMRSRMGAYASWANTSDRSTRTAAARQAAFDRFERQVDPDGTLDPEQRRLRAEAARKAYMLDLAYRSSRARQRARTANEAEKEGRTGMTTPNPSAVWSRITSYQGETFRQIRGGEFAYAVSGDYLHLDRTNQTVPRKHIEEALGLVPLDNTVAVQHLRAPSYIYAILMDDRVRGTDW